MKIKIAGRKYNRPLNYYDALLYLSLLDIDGKNDWRLPTIEEIRCMNQYMTMWASDIEYTDSEKTRKNYVIPVRDV